MTQYQWLLDIISPLDVKLGLELLEVTSKCARGRYPVAGNTQPWGLWHGGATCVVAETLASLAGMAEVGPDGRAVGVELNASHLHAATKGWVNGVATAVRIGRSLATYNVELTDDDGQLIAVARVSVMLDRVKHGTWHHHHTH